MSGDLIESTIEPRREIQERLQPNLANGVVSARFVGRAEVQEQRWLRAIAAIPLLGRNESAYLSEGAGRFACLAAAREPPLALGGVPAGVRCLLDASLPFPGVILDVKPFFAAP